jgi:hypothetical protein
MYGKVLARHRTSNIEPRTPLFGAEGGDLESDGYDVDAGVGLGFSGHQVVDLAVGDG